jgi:2-phosphoglycerate kinase
VAKITIKKDSTGERMPFLRGVLVQSIVTAGLSFQDAYEVAQLIRRQLEKDAGEIGTEELQGRVAGILRDRFDETTAEAYTAGPDGTRPLSVISSSGHRPLSTTLLTRSLEACAIPREKALDVARRVQEALLRENAFEVDKQTLSRVIYQNLQEHLNQKSADRYLSWRHFKDSDEPLIVMVGGITGTGKSTVANELGYRLNVVRTQSTDMLREIVRCYLAPEEVPTLAYSSFEAWKGLPSEQEFPELGPDVSPVIAGFNSQFNIVRVGLEATLARAVKERHDLIIDGIHVLPTKLELEAIKRSAVVVPVVLVVVTREILAARLTDRGHEQPGRASSRYLEHLDEIWDLQSYLVDLADQGEVEMVFNWEIEQTVTEILDRITRRICEKFPPDESRILAHDK